MHLCAAEGAFWSGERAANEIINRVRDTPDAYREHSEGIWYWEGRPAAAAAAAAAAIPQADAQAEHDLPVRQPEAPTLEELPASVARARVAVIGAGVAGLTAAGVLRQAGVGTIDVYALTISARHAFSTRIIFRRIVLS